MALGDGVAIANLIKDAGLCASTSEAMRMVKQGAVKIDGEKVVDPKKIVSEQKPFVLQVGKRKFVRIKPS